ncbi:SMI1/KNR4 family protein [Pseudoalteromonas rhizosphaerae]|uniref:SMI1/KNR4 family protein n=1 Tax=Pseudoalteromonas rhizosphaerae TaxID=2518973 RepID=A0ABW8L2C6_9GAMM
MQESFQSCSGGASDEEIAKLLEWAINKIPNDYLNILKETNGYESSADFKEYYRLWSIDEIIENNEGYEVQKYLQNHIGIGDAGGLSMYLLNLSAGTVHRYPFPLDHCYEEKVAESFTNLLSRINNLGNK